MRPVDEDEISLGIPLPWPVFDRAGKLLLGQGAVVTDPAQRHALLLRGVMAPVARSLQRPGEPSPPPPSTIDVLHALQRELAFLHRKLLLREAGSSAVRVRALADEIVAQVARDADAALAAMQLELDPANHAARHVHAAVVCVLAARSLSLSRADGEALVASALTFDVALGPLATRLNGQLGDLSPAQRRQVEVHAEDGCLLLAAAGVDDPRWLDAVLHHHERLDGSGYPHGLRDADIPVTTRMLAIADIYTAMVRPRAYRQAMHARNALRSIFIERGRLVDEGLATMLVKEIGVYPPGTLVRLANQEVGVVLRRGPDAARPLVARLLTAEGQRAGVPVLRDTREAELAIVEAVARERHPGLMSNLAALWPG